jgi:tetratricopeptide (TPR) repeat protein
MKANGPGVSIKARIQLVCWTLLVAGFLGIVPLQKKIDAELQSAGMFADILYFPSGHWLRRASLGHEGLLADVYWTRVVQYFGRQRLEHVSQFELLGPLLRITTELDPHLLIAYRFGAIFLAEPPPRGAGRPEEALQLLRRGIVANPDYWRLWQDLGFIYYWDLKDYDSAARVFQAGSERPGAMVWMKVLAATVSAEGGAIQTSRLLWSEIYRQADNDQIRQRAREQLAALKAQEDLQNLDRLLTEFQERQGHPAASLQELVVAGLLRGIPVDPSGAPYRIGADGRAKLSPKSRIDLRLFQ